MNKTHRLGLLLLASAVFVLARSAFAQNATGGVTPLSLSEAIRLAMAHSPDVAIASAQIVRAGEAVRETRSSNQPQIVTGTGLAYNNGFPLSIEGAAPSIFQVGLTKAILSMKNNNLIREAEEAAKGSATTVDSARNELAAKTSSVYYEIFRARKVRDLWTARLEDARQDSQITETLVDAGRAKPIDLTLARTAAAYAQQQVLVASEQARIAEGELRELAGIPEGTVIAVMEPIIDDQAVTRTGEDLYQKAIETSPGIRQAESIVRAQEFHVEAERGEGRPRMEIVSQYALFSRTNNYDEFFQKFTRNNFLVGLSIQVPIFSGFGTSARVAQSRQHVVEARLRLQSLKSELKMNIERGLSAVKIASGAAALARQEVSAARENLQVSRTLLEAGRASQKDFDGARTQVSEKEIAAIEADRTLFERKIDLLRVMGDLSTHFPDGLQSSSETYER